MVPPSSASVFPLRMADRGLPIYGRGASLPMSKTPTTTADAATLAAPRGTRRATTLLVVDDEPLIRDTLAEYLGQEGFRVATCASGEEALELAGQHCFDVALCDL